MLYKFLFVSICIAQNPVIIGMGQNGWICIGIYLRQTMRHLSGTIILEKGEIAPGNIELLLVVKPEPCTPAGLLCRGRTLSQVVHNEILFLLSVCPKSRTLSSPARPP